MFWGESLQWFWTAQPRIGWRTGEDLDDGSSICSVYKVYIDQTERGRKEGQKKKKKMVMERKRMEE